MPTPRSRCAPRSKKTGLISLTEQGKATIESVAYLQAQIQAKQVQLGAMRTGMTESNPDYVRAQKELAGLQVELAQAGEDQSGRYQRRHPFGGSIPERGLEYVRKFRDVQYYQTLFDLSPSSTRSPRRRKPPRPA